MPETVFAEGCDQLFQRHVILRVQRRRRGDQVVVPAAVKQLLRRTGVDHQGAARSQHSRHFAKGPAADGVQRRIVSQMVQHLVDHTAVDGAIAKGEVVDARFVKVNPPLVVLFTKLLLCDSEHAYGFRTSH